MAMSKITSRTRLVNVLATACLAVLIALSGCSEGGDSGSAAPAGSAQSQQTAAKSKKTTQKLTDLVAEFIDVGQGDSELIKLPDGKVMLIDAGDVSAGQTVVDALSEANVDTIDHLVATHPHADHVGGMPAVLGATKVKNVWMPNAAGDSETYNQFIDAVDDEGAKVHEAKAGEKIVSSKAGYSVDILAPAEDTQSDNLNDYSAIIRVKYGDTAMLFTGDASAQEIVDAAAGHVDVLKVAHHGSETGTTAAVMNALNPTYAVMSYAEGNDYGHPRQDVLDAILAAGATAYSTAANGDVTVTSDGESVEVETEKEGSITAGVSAAEREAQARAEAERKAQEEAAAQQRAQEEAAAQARAAQEAQAQAQAQAQQAAQEATVYITNTGTKYHNAGCRSLWKSSIPISKGDAMARGYEPCKVCNP